MTSPVVDGWRCLLNASGARNHPRAYGGDGFPVPGAAPRHLAEERRVVGYPEAEGGERLPGAFLKTVGAPDGATTKWTRSARIP
ncbi:hypothetical protein J7I98_17725 [Streptomyces sp. ISL-98]|nr:hypothetical protein [Streptomyces sp. ISL-98]